MISIEKFDISPGLYNAEQYLQLDTFSVESQFFIVCVKIVINKCISIVIFNHDMIGDVL